VSTLAVVVAEFRPVDFIAKSFRAPAAPEGDRPLFAQETTRASRLKSLLQMSGHASIAGAIA